MRELIEQFYAENFNLLVLRLTRKAGSPENAEDIVQSSFERALRYSDSFNPNINDFTTWLNSIIRRVIVDFKREETRMGMVLESEDAIEDEFVAFTPPDPEYAEWIEEAIEAKTNVNHRNILFLHFKRDYKPSEIIKVVDESYKNIERILERFRKEQIERYGSTVR